MKYKESVKEVVWIERMINGKSYKEISQKLGISIYFIKKIINERRTK